MFVRSIIDLGGAVRRPRDRRLDAGPARRRRRCPDGSRLPLRGGWIELGEQHARNHGVPLLYEPLNRYETNQANTLADGVRLLQSLSTTNVRLLADLFHMNIEDADLAASIRAAGPAIGHVHFVDSNRRPAGMGHLDYAPNRHRAARRHRLRSLPVRGGGLALPDSETAAKQTIDTFRRWFR